MAYSGIRTPLSPRSLRSQLLKSRYQMGDILEPGDPKTWWSYWGFQNDEAPLSQPFWGKTPIQSFLYPLTQAVGDRRIR